MDGEKIQLKMYKGYPVLNRFGQALISGEIAAGSHVTVKWSASASSWLMLDSTIAVPTVPTAAPGTSNTQAASTAFVAAALLASYSISEPDSSTVVYTLPGGYKLMAFNRTVNNSSTVGTGVTTAITFPQAFPARVVAVFATKKNYVQAAVSCENQTLTGFDAVVTLITSISGGITATQAMFLAIGK